MSTRRARIKAVAALPPRRKNADTVDGSKTKPIPVKETAEKALKSPSTPRSLAANTPEEKNTPALKTLRPTPQLIPISRTPNLTENVPSSPVNVAPSAAQVSPILTEKVPVVKSTSSNKNISNVFASPPAKSSPDVRQIASPIGSPSPRRAKNIQSFVIESLSADLLDDIGNNELKASKNNESVDKILSLDKKNDIPDDYSVPSVPESITDETGMDGIVPLRPACSAANPKDLLKNEIISEYAEALFDPIVPLPSPSKVRPKLRPVPRLAPHRRNSVQGSASESEDDSRRALLGSGAPAPAPSRQRHDSHTSHSTLHSVPNREANRIRNDSVCSTVSQATIQPPPATSPVKEKHIIKTRRQEMSKRMWRRRRETVKRDALTMYDLIFYNPTTNPIIPDQDELKAKEANAKEEAERKVKTQESEEEEVDDPPAAAAAPVPQIKIGPNGEIMLDEKSLVIKQSDSNRKVSSVVREGAWGGGGGRYTRAARTADWSQAETVRFYRALAAIGTDFSLMAPLFPDRNRKDLKLKFKKEERLNGAQVDKALRSATTFDVARLQEEFRVERAEAARRAEVERQKLAENKKAEKERMRAAKELRVRLSKGSKALESSTNYAINSEMTADAFIQRAMETRNKMKNKTNPTSSETQDVPQMSLHNTSQKPHAFATLTLMNKNPTPPLNKTPPEMATISRIEQKNTISGVPSNIETGSLVVLRVNDPNSPSKTMLQTYISNGPGKLTPIALPSTFLNSVVGYMKKGMPKSGMSTGSSPQLKSPSSVSSQDSRSTPGVIQLNPSPAKRQRHSSYTITPL